jgi:dihydrofolate reductase
MSKVVLDVAMSLDGFTAGPNIGEAEPVGEGGERLHEWMWVAGNGPDGGVDIGFRTVDAVVGAAVIGRRTFDGLEAAARRARDVAGDKDVLVLGAHVAGQLLRAGLLDEVRIHLVPLLLGQGTPLFAGERAELIPEGKPVAGAVTHLRYRVAKP